MNTLYTVLALNTVLISMLLRHVFCAPVHRLLLPVYASPVVSVCYTQRHISATSTFMRVSRITRTCKMPQRKQQQSDVLVKRRHHACTRSDLYCH
jgi:hypothetical protein